MIRKFADILYDVTLGLLKQYQSRAVDLARIEAATLYLKAVKALRNHALAAAGIIFCFVFMAVALVIIPLSVVFCLPLPPAAKITAILALGILDICVPLAFLNRFFSEETWMKISRSDELIGKVMDRQS